MQPRVGELLALGFRGTRVPFWLRDFERRHGLGGVLLFDRDLRSRGPRNVESPAQLRALCEALHALPSRPLVLVDQEGGQVRRLKEARGFAPLPSAAAQAALPRAARRALLRASCEQMAGLGIDMDLAPVVDVDANPDNPNLGALERCFSADPAVVAENARLWADAARRAGLLLCLKHYPGLGAARTDSHTHRTDLSGTLDPTQLDLFHVLAAETPGRAVLLCHALVKEWDPERPVSVSPAAVGRLREAVPEALLLSDDLGMQGVRAWLDVPAAAVAALAAGVDLALVGNNLAGADADPRALASRLEEAVAADPRLAERARAAAARVAQRKRAFSGSA